MKQQQTNQIENMVSRRVSSGKLRRVVAMLSAFVLFTTMNTLKFNADTLERVATCGMQEHIHLAECYDGDSLTCGLAEHVHTDACYQQRPTADDIAVTRIDEYVPINAQVNLVTDLEEADDDWEIGIEPVDPEVDETETEMGGASATGGNAADDSAFTVDDDHTDPVAQETPAVDTQAENENTEYVCEIGDRAQVLLSAVLAEVGLEVGDIADVGAAKSDEDRVSVQTDGDDYVVTPLVSFEKAEIVVVAADGDYVVTLTNAVVTEASEDEKETETEAIEEPDTENTETEEDAAAQIETDEAEAEKAEEVKADESADEAEEEKIDEETAEETTDEKADEEADGEERIDEDESEAQETVDAAGILQNDSVTIVPAGDTTLSANTQIEYSEIADKQGVVDMLNALLAANAPRKLMKSARGRMMAAASIDSAASADNGGQIVDYAVFDISLLDEGAEQPEPGEVGVVVRPQNVNIFENLPDNAVVTGVDYTLYHIHNNNVETLPVSVDCGDDGALLAVDFSTDKFSYFVLKYTVDFEYTDPETGFTTAWKWPGQGSYAIADILKEIGVEGEISDVSLLRTIDVGGSDKVLYLSEDETELISEEAFQDTFELTVAVDGKRYVFVVTDEGSDAVDKGTTVEAYFIDGDGVRQDEISVKSGEPINARIKLETASATDGSDQYVKVALNGLDSKYITMNNALTENAWGNLTIRDSTTHEYKTIGVYYDTEKNEIIYRVPPGTTAIQSLNFIAPNGITPNGESITLVPSKCDAQGNPVTPAANDHIGDPAEGKWVSEFGWDPINKTVNNVKENTISAFMNGTKAKLDDWLVYNYTANSQNNANVGVRWTDEMIITDTLTLPENITFPDSAGISLSGNNLMVGGDILFGLTLNNDTGYTMTLDSWSINGKQLTFTVKVNNTNISDGELTREMPNLSFQGELNLDKLALPDNYISEEKYTDEKIVNHVKVTEVPNKGTERPNSESDAKTNIKASNGYKVEKESEKDGETVKAGDSIDYTVKLRNVGALVLTGKDVLEDTLPNTVKLTDTQASQVQVKIYSGDTDTTGRDGDSTKLVVDAANNKITYNPEGLKPGERVEISFTATVVDAQKLQDLNVQNNDTITNYVHYKDESSYVSSRIEKGHVTVDKMGTTTDVVNDGDTVGYTIKVKNDSGAPVPSHITLVDQLPRYLELQLYSERNNDDSLIKDLYDNLPKTISPAYIRAADTDSNYTYGSKYCEVSVTIDDKGNAKISADIKDLGIGGETLYGYQVKFNAGKVGESGATVSDGIVKFDNIAKTSTGDEDHEPFQGKTGEVGIEKYWDAAELDKTDVIEPFEDQTIITYNVKVTNSTDNPYNYDFDVTDEIPKGLFPLGLTGSDGTTALDTYAKLEAYVQATSGHINNEAAAKLNGEDIKVRFNNGQIVIKWTIDNATNHITDKIIIYQCKFVADDLDTSAEGTKILKNKASTMGKEATEEVEVHVEGVKPVKQIVDGSGNTVKEISIGPGETTTYILTIENPKGLEAVLNDVRDWLPYGGQIGSSYWVLGETVFVETEDTAYNQFVENATVNNGNLYWMNSGYLYFGTITVPAGTTVLKQKVSLKWPEDTEKFRSFWTDQYNLKSKNSFYIGTTHDDVDHKEKTDKKYYLQKSVLAFSRQNEYGNPVTNRSKDLFKVGDIEYVYYTIAFANTGTGKLHINSLTDILPDELEFIGISGNDSSAGTQYYKVNGLDVWDTEKKKNTFTGVTEITTQSENNNPSIKMPGYAYVYDQKVTASVNESNVVFSINDGAGVDLAEKQAIYFNVMCGIKEGATLTNGQAITNTVQAEVDKDAELKKTSITTQKTPSDSVQNNGGCDEIAEGTTTKTAQSSVTIHPMEIAVPGIKKQAVAYKTIGAENWNTQLDHLTNIETSNSELKWEITLYNDGTVPIDQGYTLTDDLFWYDVFQSAEFAIYDESGSVVRTPTLPAVTASEWTSIPADGEYRHYSWTFDNSADYVIPAGGKAVLTMITNYDRDVYQGQVDNKAVFSPVQSWDANRVVHGQLEKNADGDSYTGVSSSDYVNMYGDGATVSYKSVQEKDDATNIAYGYDIGVGNNKIVLDSKDDLITYTNFVKNLSKGAFQTFTMIDRMPALNDVGAQNASQSRGSEFAVNLASTIKLNLKSGDGYSKIELSPEDYTIQYKNQDPSAAFTQDDWDGKSAWSDDPAGTNAFRIVLNPDTLTGKINTIGNSSMAQAVFPPDWVLEVSYDARLDSAASAGQTAYNSFGYRYIESGGTKLEAEPPMVGVTLPKEPVIRKIVLDEDGKDLGVDETKKFTFTFYKGTYTPEQIASANPAIEKLWETEVYQGQALKLPVKGIVNGVTVGYFEDGENYTVVETPVDGYSIFKYEVDGLTQTTKNYSNFKFDSSINTTVVAYNLKKSGFTPQAEKTLKGRALQNEEFEFELYEVDKTKDPATLTPKQTVKNDGNGVVKFAPLSYEEEGTHYYQIKEKIGSADDIKYDETVYELTVTAEQKGDVITTTGVYKKVGDTNNLQEGKVPTFANEVVTSIEVEKVWAGTPGTATMVLYQAVGDKDDPDNDPVPSQTFDVTVQAALKDSVDSTKDGTPKGTTNITATFTTEGETPVVVTLNNANSWQGSATLTRGKVYSVAYATNAETLITHIVSPDHVTDITDPETLHVTAKAVAAAQYDVKFSVDNFAGKSGTVNVAFTHNGDERTIVLNKDHSTETVKVTEEDSYSYAISSANGFITGFTAPSSLTNSVSSVSEGEDVSITADFAETTMTVPVSVTWDSVPDQDTSVTVTLTPNKGSAQTVTLGWANNTTWSDNKVLDRFDDDGNLLTWTPSYAVTVPEGGAAATIKNTAPAISGSGSVAYTGEVARGMTLTFSWDCKNDYVQVDKIDIVDSNAQIKTDNYKGQINLNTSNIPYTPSYTLEVKDSAGDIYYGFWFRGGGTNKWKITTNNDTAKLIDLYGSFVYFKAKGGNVLFMFEAVSDEDKLIIDKNLSFDQTTQSTSAASMQSRNASSQNVGALSLSKKITGGKGMTGDEVLSLLSNGSNNTKFYDDGRNPTVNSDIPTGGVPFAAVQAKDLPTGAGVVETLPNGTDGKAQTAEVTITGNDSKSWTNLPTVDDHGNPIYYYIVEKDATAAADTMTARYSYTYNADGTISKVTITNTTTSEEPQTADLTVTKNLTKANTSGADLSFYVGLFTDSTGTTKATGVGTNPQQVTVAQNATAGTVTFSGLTIGTTYYVFETNASGVKVSTTDKVSGYAIQADDVNGKTVTIAASGNTATITNAYSATGTVSFKAKKTLEGGTLANEQFSFTLTEYTDNTFATEKNGGVSQTKTNAAPAGSATFGEVAFDDVSLSSTGTRYFIIKETVPTGNAADGSIIYDTHMQKVTVTVTDDGAGNLTATKTYDPTYSESGYDASFTNTKKGALKLTKEVTVNGAATTGTQADGEYTFTVAKDNATVATVVIKVENGVATQYKVDTAETYTNLPADKFVVIGDLVPGAYTITETTPTNGTTISKINGTDSTVYYTTVTVVAGDTAAARASATFTNNKSEKGTLTVNKTVKYNDAVDTEAGTTATPAEFKVAIFTREGTDPDYTYTKVGETKTIKVVAGVTTQAAVFDNLDLDTTYYVFEMDGEKRVDTSFGSYTVTGSGTAFTPTSSEQTKTVEIVNAQTETGSLAVTKEIKVNGAASNRSGSFNVALYKVIPASEDAEEPDATPETEDAGEPDATPETEDAEEPATAPAATEEIVGTPKQITVTNGVSTTVTFSNLDIGSTYKVYEVTVDDTTTPATVTQVGSQFGIYTVSYDNQTVTIPRGTGRNVTGTKVINNIETTSIKVDKKWYQETDTTKAAPLTVSNASITVKLTDGTNDVTEDASGTAIAAVTLTGSETTAWTYEWTNLPKYNASGAEINYKVVETSAKVETNKDGGTELLTTNKEAVADTDPAKANERHLENTLPNITISGSKTWVDEKNSHDAPALTLTRTSAKSGSEPETLKAAENTPTVYSAAGTVNLQPVWDGLSYSYSNLPKYDAEGYLYTYAVTEDAIEGYKSEESSSNDASGFGKNFVNTELTTIRATKVWKLNKQEITDPDGITSITLHLNRTNGETGYVSSEANNPFYTADEKNASDTTYAPFTIERTGEAGSYSWPTLEIQNLPKYYLDGDEVKPYTYFFTEDMTDLTGWSATYSKADGTPSSTGSTITTNGDETITITNSKYSVALPSTGGPGTAIFYGAGASLMLFAFLGFVLNARKKERDGI